MTRPPIRRQYRRLACITLVCGTLIGLVPGGDAADVPQVQGTPMPSPVILNGAVIGEPVPHFETEIATLTGDTVETAAFASQRANRVTAYVFIGSTCPTTRAYADRFKSLAAAYTPKGVDFIYLYPNNDDPRDVQVAFHKDRQLGGRVIDDRGGRLARLFKVRRTTEVFVTDTRNVVVYHGAVDDSRDPARVNRHYLATALDEVLAGKPVTITSTEVYACGIHP